jgi:NitT/TauT family transport system substrate-binding protein
MNRSALRIPAVILGIAFAHQAPSAAGAESIKVGLLPISGSAPVFIAEEKGYFTAEGLDVQIVNFDAAQPTAVATVSGDIDFGVAGLSSALYTLCGEGALRIIAGATGFPR